MKDSKQNIQQCEEYEMDVLSDKELLSAELPGDLRHSLKTAIDGKIRTASGLCSNCSHWKDCVFPKPESGVWHCEEYS